MTTTTITTPDLAVPPRKSARSNITAYVLRYDYAVFLTARGNPDKGENPHALIAPEQIGFGNTFADVSRACRDFISLYNIGGGNWVGGEVYETADLLKKPKLVAFVSFNGCVWQVDDIMQVHALGDYPLLYDPSNPEGE